MGYGVSIVGSGAVGGTLALALAAAGIEVALVDPRERSAPRPEPFDQRVYALRPSSIELLARCGVWQRVDPARVAPVHEMSVQGDDGRSTLTFDAYRAGLAELAAIIEDWNLQRALRESLDAQPLVTTYRGRRCVGAQWAEDTVSVELDDGVRIGAALAVAADGSESRLREFAGIRVREKTYAQQGVVANFRTSLSHHSIARQWFRRDGILALLPLPGDHVSMVWSTPASHAQALVACTAAQLSAQVTEASGAILGELTALGPAIAFPLRSMRAESIAGPRIALVGDAAHNVHPLAGQGLNLGLADAATLAAILAAPAPGEDFGSRALLARYRRERAEEIALMALVTDGLQRLFSSRLPGIGLARNIGLRITDAILPLKRALVKRAAG